MVISAVQMNSRDSKEENLNKAESLIDRAAEKGAEVVLLPEMFNYLGPSEKKLANSEPIPGPTIERLARKALKHGIYLLCGSILETGDVEGKVYNTSVFLDPSGEIIAKYRKIHLFDVSIEGEPVYEESATVQPGAEVSTTETNLTTFGLSICYDIRFPEIYRRLTIRGARVIFLPAAFTLYTGKDHWEPLIRARAIENQVYIASSAQFGFHPPNKQCYGKSIIVDPWGTVIAKAPDQETVILAELDFTYQDKVRRELPSLNHRREDIFSL